MNQTVEAIASIVFAIIAVAIVAVLVSKNAQTGSILTSAGTALGGVITAATAPVSSGNGGGNFGTSG